MSYLYHEDVLTATRLEVWAERFEKAGMPLHAAVLRDQAQNVWPADVAPAVRAELVSLTIECTDWEVRWALTDQMFNVVRELILAGTNA